MMENLGIFFTITICIVVILFVVYIFKPHHPIFAHLSSAYQRILQSLDIVWKNISGKGKRERKEEERRREEKRLQEPKEKWKGLIDEMGFHVGPTERLREIPPSKHAKDYKSMQKTIIRYLREFGFFMPSEAEMIRDDFHERWLKFLKEFFEVEKIHQRYPDQPPTEEELLTLWERIKSKSKKGVVVLGVLNQ